uniref:Protein kinase domain-containing protein n=1 Tax=Alexandrium monilatum TaxID=311494 RepID=A0A7S4WAD9_9DINO
MAAQTWKTTPAVFGFSGTAAASLISWSLCLDIVIWEVVIRYWGLPSEVRVHFTSLLYSIGWFGVAWMNAGRLCSIFDAQVALAAEKALMESIISMLCDATVWLSDDGNTIVRADQRLNLILGRNVEGQRVDSILPPCEQERLQGGVSQARAAPVLLPSTLRSSTGRIISVDMFIVNRDINAKGEKDQTPAFLIGLKISREPGGEELPSSVLGKACESRLAEARLAVEPQPEDGASSHPETTVTGHLFESLNVARWLRGLSEERATELREGLEKLAMLGQQERWLVAFPEIDFSASKVLGAGSFGAVASASLHGTPIAVKTTKHGEHNGKVEHLLAVANEIRILRHVRHPCVVLFHGACVEPERGEVMLILERVHGEELSRYVMKHSTAPEVPDRYRLLLDIASALRYLHAQSPRVVHGDLKGPNILVETAVPRAKLVDFGLSRLLTSHAKPLGGTLTWVAPEIITSSGRPQASADVFSFGRVTYMIVTCQKPLQGVEGRVIARMAHRGVPHELQWHEDRPLHRECRELCRDVLSLVPAQRPSMAQVHIEISSWTVPGVSEPIPTQATQAGPPGRADDGNQRMPSFRNLLDTALVQQHAAGAPPVPEAHGAANQAGGAALDLNLQQRPEPRTRPRGSRDRAPSIQVVSGQNCVAMIDVKDGRFVSVTEECRRLRDVSLEVGASVREFLAKPDEFEQWLKRCVDAIRGGDLALGAPLGVQIVVKKRPDQRPVWMSCTGVFLAEDGDPASSLRLQLTILMCISYMERETLGMQARAEEDTSSLYVLSEEDYAPTTSGVSEEGHAGHLGAGSHIESL